MFAEADEPCNGWPVQPTKADSLIVRAALRSATGPVHERLHQVRPFAAIAEERLDLAGYADLLARIAAFHFTTAAQIDLSSDRLRLLSEDLAYLAICLPDQFVSWSPPEDPAAKLGCAYVIEGSALGGRIIYRQLDYLFGASANGRLFFRGSQEGPARWRRLCSQLEEEGTDPVRLSAIVAGAEATFSLFEEIVTRETVHA